MLIIQHNDDGTYKSVPARKVVLTLEGGAEVDGEEVTVDIAPESKFLLEPEDALKLADQK